MNFDEVHSNLTLEEAIDTRVFSNARPVTVLDAFDIRPLELFLNGNSIIPHGEIVSEVLPPSIQIKKVSLWEAEIEDICENVTLSAAEMLTKSAIYYAKTLAKQFVAMVNDGLRNCIVTISAISIPDTFDVNENDPLWEAVNDLRNIIHYMQNLGIDIVVAEGNFPTKNNATYDRSLMLFFKHNRPFNIFTPISEVFHVGGVHFEDGQYYLNGLPANVDVWAPSMVKYDGEVHFGNSFAAPRFATALSLFYAVYPELAESAGPARHKILGQMIKKSSQVIETAITFDVHRQLSNTTGVYDPRTVSGVPVLSEKKLAEFLTGERMDPVAFEL